MSNYEIIGLMSGTSLDGLDIAHVRFDLTNNSTDSFVLLNADSVPLPAELIEKLMDAPNYSVAKILRLDKDFGKFLAQSVLKFIEKNKIDKNNIQAIASHGQTILHQPNNGFTLQIGCGSTLSFHTGLNVINDFRTKDIVAGGQGAPLVPVGDFGLFSDLAEGFLNIGGFANVSFKKNDRIVAYDICPGNLPMNKLAHARNLAYDKNGKLAKSGEINFFLLDLLNSLDYYHLDGPKSLGTEWLEEFYYPLLKFDKEIENNLRTVVEHSAVQISNVLNGANLSSVLVTGGGAKNGFLIERIQHYFNGTLILPSQQIIDFKEAIVFAYLGALYLDKRPNALASVTGASKNTIGGVFHVPD
jgi:anhydro-N-acetylmuramic acid kinase